MKFALEGHDTEDWGDGPSLNTHYDYPTFDDAVEGAHQWMKDRIAAGIPESQVGCYIVSDALRNGSDPVVEDLCTIRQDVFVNNDIESRLATS